MLRRLVGYAPRCRGILRRACVGAKARSLPTPFRRASASGGRCQEWRPADITRRVRGHCARSSSAVLSDQRDAPKESRWWNIRCFKMMFGFGSERKTSPGKDGRSWLRCWRRGLHIPARSVEVAEGAQTDSSSGAHYSTHCTHIWVTRTHTRSRSPRAISGLFPAVSMSSSHIRS